MTLRRTGLYAGYRAKSSPVITARVLFLVLGFIGVLVGNSAGFRAQEPELTRRALWRKQREVKSQSLETDPPNPAERAALFIHREKVLQKLELGWNGFHPKLGGLSTGSGLAGGIRYAPTLLGGALDFQASGAISTRVYQLYDLRFGAPRLLKGKLFANFYSRYRSFPQINFFGLGPNSTKNNRTDFALEDSIYDATLGVNWTKWLASGIQLGYLKTNVGRGTDSRFTNTEDLFSPTSLPGLAVQPNFYHTDAFLKIDYRDVPTNPRSGGYYDFNFSYFDDQKLNSHTFRRYDIEVQQYFPFFKQRRVIAFRALTSLSDVSPGQSVPFYMMKTVGGSESLRGFREFRFRDQNLLLFNLEYRWEAFSGLDMAIFGDAGKVAARRSDIDLSKLRTDVGFGFRFNTAKSVFLRVDVGFSNEGTRFFFKFGPAF